MPKYSISFFTEGIFNFINIGRSEVLLPRFMRHDGFLFII